jgi:hypothetical protein
LAPAQALRQTAGEMRMVARALLQAAFKQNDPLFLVERRRHRGLQDSIGRMGRLAGSRNEISARPIVNMG